MATPSHDDETERPLDPAAERVRRKLMRFVAINLGLLFVAVMAVMGAVVYQTWWTGEDAAEPPALAGGETLAEGTIALPDGARLVSHAASGRQLTLHLALPDGSAAILVYDMAAGAMVGRFALATAPAGAVPEGAE